MQIDCDESIEGMYIIYSNMNCDDVGDGHSALFGLMDDIYLDKLIRSRFSDGKPRNKIYELGSDIEFAVLDVDIETKRPSIPRTIHTRPNVTTVTAGAAPATAQSRFIKKIAHDDERYRRILELFVAPLEY